MILLLPLLVPLLAAFVVLGCKSPRKAAAVALSSGALELLAIGNAVWRIHAAGTVQAGRYLRADARTSLFLINIGIVFALVLAYSVAYLRHIPEGRFSSPRWFYAL